MPSSSNGSFTPINLNESEEPLDHDIAEYPSIFGDIKFPTRGGSSGGGGGGGFNRSSPGKKKKKPKKDKKMRGGGNSSGGKHRPLPTAEDHFNIALSYVSDDSSNEGGVGELDDELDGYQVYLRGIPASVRSHEYPALDDDDYLLRQVRKQRRCRLATLSIAVLSVITLLSVGLITIVKKRHGGIHDDPYAGKPLGDDEHDSVMMLLGEISPLADLQNVNDNANDGSGSGGDELTPQRRAFKWLSGDTFLEAYLQFGPDADFEGEPIKTAVLTRYALATLFFATGGHEGHRNPGAGWKDKTNWLTQYHICDWSGVTCGDDDQGGNSRRVTELRLVGNQLKGSLPNEMKALNHLEKLDLSHNELTGQMSFPGLSHLLELTDLRLSNNQLMGNIDPNLLKSLRKLEVLVLNDNNMGGEIPQAIGQMEYLFLLRLSDNHFTGSIPPEMGKLSRLFEVDLSQNDLQGPIPEQVGWLGQMQELRLSGNHLVGPVPASFRQLNELVQLRLDDNELTGQLSPGILAGLASLKGLYLDHNQLTGAVPPEMGSHLRELQELTLEGNRFVGSVPPSICQLPMIRLLSADCDLGCTCCTANSCSQGGDNGGGGGGDDDKDKNSALALLAEVSDTTTFQELGSPQSMALEWIQDDRSYELFSQTSTDDIDETMYHGIPLKTAVKHRYAMALFYYATGGTPWPGAANGWKDSTSWLSDTPICQWFGVTCGPEGMVLRVELEDNGLLGILPDEIGAVYSLRALDLRSNHLGGEVPSGLADLTDLTELQLQNNNLVGTVPQVICSSLPNLNVFTADCFDGIGQVQCSCCTTCFKGN